MVVIVTGSNGQLGQALQSIADRYPVIQFIFTTSKELDITNPESIRLIFKESNPTFCINAAAYTAVDKAESEPEKAEAINVIAAKNLAQICKDFNVTLLHVSTDFVFDGNKNTPYTEVDIANPQSVYGKTKLDGEKAIQAVLSQYYIIRTSWLYSEFGNNFMKTMLRLAKEKTTLSVVDDQIGTPTHALDLAEALLTIIQSDSKNYGIYHFSNEGTASWYDFAKEIFQANKVQMDLNPIPTTQFPTPAKRPKYSVLDKSKIKKTFGITISSWESSLARKSQ